MDCTWPWGGQKAGGRVEIFTRVEKRILMEKKGEGNRENKRVNIAQEKGVDSERVRWIVT